MTGDKPVTTNQESSPDSTVISAVNQLVLASGQASLVALAPCAGKEPEWC
jgi:hypothetical protein